MLAERTSGAGGGGGGERIKGWYSQEDTGFPDDPKNGGGFRRSEAVVRF